MDERTVEVEVHREEGGYWASVTDLPGCFTIADTLDELLVMLTDAISVYLDETPTRDADEAEDDEAVADPVDRETRYLTRVVGLRLAIERDMRPAGVDAISLPPERRKRESHREWPSERRRDDD